MSKVVVAPGETIDPSIFFPNIGSNVIGGTLKGVLNQVGNLVNGIGNSTTTYHDLTFGVGDLTYHLLGNFSLDVVGGLLGADTSASGSYSKIVIDKAGQFLTSLSLDKALDVDLGHTSNLNILGLNLGDLLHVALGDVLGTVDDLLGAVTADVTPAVTNLVDSLVSDAQDDGPTPGNDKLEGTKGKDVINALAGDDIVHARGGNDTIHGDQGADKIWGNAGKDKLFGDGGNDVLKGGGGADKLTGGKGHDMLVGGGGADTFIFAHTSDSKAKGHGWDTISDFHHNQHDKIDLHAIDADTTHGGDQAFDFHRGHFTGDAGELITSTKGSETYVMGDVNGDGKADFEIELHGKIHLHASDFHL